MQMLTVDTMVLAATLGFSAFLANKYEEPWFDYLGLGDVSDIRMFESSLGFGTFVVSSNLIS